MTPRSAAADAATAANTAANAASSPPRGGIFRKLGSRLSISASKAPTAGHTPHTTARGANPDAYPPMGPTSTSEPQPAARRSFANPFGRKSPVVEVGPAAAKDSAAAARAQRWLGSAAVALGRASGTIQRPSSPTVKKSVTHGQCISQPAADSTSGRWSGVSAASSADEGPLGKMRELLEGNSRLALDLPLLNPLLHLDLPMTAPALAYADDARAEARAHRAAVRGKLVR